MADRSPARSLALSLGTRKAPKADSLEVSGSVSSHPYGVPLGTLSVCPLDYDNGRINHPGVPRILSCLP